mmetsp:Transcript_47709/g.91153  ORF Transcript_47709/g.91153 Transcript_47709/m.91153 type:complete len:316 (+) Transcript_47709:1484-2431(+)
MVELACKNASDLLRDVRMLDGLGEPTQVGESFGEVTSSSWSLCTGMSSTRLGELLTFKALGYTLELRWRRGDVGVLSGLGLRLLRRSASLDKRRWSSSSLPLMITVSPAWRSKEACSSMVSANSARSSSVADKGTAFAKLVALRARVLFGLAQGESRGVEVFESLSAALARTGAMMRLMDWRRSSLGFLSTPPLELISASASLRIRDGDMRLPGMLAQSPLEPASPLSATTRLDMELRLVSPTPSDLLLCRSGRSPGPPANVNRTALCVGELRVLLASPPSAISASASKYPKRLSGSLTYRSTMLWFLKLNFSSP